jgi:glycosyltransferase involved in cell wall biosynthesis
VEIIAAIPCFNTEPRIRGIVLKAKEHAHQVVVIDDGSHDGTGEAAKAAGALIVSHGGNRGYGEAIKSCFEAAKVNGTDALVVLDGDGQHNPDELPSVLAPILDGRADLVLGSRFLVKVHNMPTYRRFGISVITWLYNLGSRDKVSDSQTGFRAYSRKAFEAISITEKGMGVSIEILEQARRKKLVIREVPISCAYFHSRLDIPTIRHGLRVALGVLRIRFKSRVYHA